MKPMGVSGTSVQGGYVRTIDRNANWVGHNKYVTSSDIAVNVSIVAASVHYFLNLLAHPQWSVQPAEEGNDEAQRLADFVEEIIYDMKTPWSRIVRRAGMYRFHGFGTQEWIAKKRKDGKIGFADIEARPQHTIERWEIEDDGNILGVWQRSPNTGALLGLPRTKLLYLVDDTLTDSPEGLGMFRHLAEPYNRLKQYLELEARAYERDLRGIPIGRAPITLINQAVQAGRLEKEVAKAAIEGLKSFVMLEMKKPDTGLILDSQPFESQTVSGLAVTGTPQWAIELLSGTGAGLSEMASAIDRLQREMARILGTEILMMGDAGGNRALAVDKSRNLYLIANAVLGTIADGMREDIVGPIWDLNGFPEELKPYLAAEDVAFRDVAEVTAALASMATAGAVLDPTDPVIDDVRDLLGVSHAPEPTPMLLGDFGRDDEGEMLGQDELAQAEMGRMKEEMRMAQQFAPKPPANSNKKPPAKKPVKKANGALTDAEIASINRFVETGEGLFIERRRQ